MRENHARRLETPPHKNAEASTKEASTKEASTSKNTAELRRRNEAGGSNKLSNEAPLTSANEMNELGWSFRSRTTKIGSTSIFDEYMLIQSSFDDRFAAAFDVSSVSQPSIIQRMMDPVGAIP